MYKKLSIFIFLFVLITGLFSFADTNPKWFPAQINMKPASPAIGNTVTFSATFRVAKGDVQNLQVIGGVDNITIWDNTYPRLKKSEDVNVKFQWIATNGKHTAFFQIDPQNTSGDSNPNDNRIELKFSVGESSTPGEEPDFVISNVRLPDGSTIADDLVLTICCDGNTTGYSGPMVISYRMDGVEFHRSINSKGYGGCRGWVAKGVGPHTVSCHADPDNIVVEKDEKNNTKSAKITVTKPGPTGLPDLTVNLIKIDPRGDGNQGYIRADISNAGTAPTDKPAPAVLRIYQKPGVTIKEETIVFPVIEPGNTVPITWKFELKNSGKFTFEVTADDDNRIKESREDNNRATEEYSWEPQSKPDLVITSFVTEDNKTAITIGESLQMVCFYKNAGGTNTKPWKVRMTAANIDLKDFQEMTADGVNPSGYAQWLWTPKVYGTYRLDCYLDSKYVIAESNEDNNNKFIKFVVMAKLIKPVIPFIKGVTLYEHINYEGIADLLIGDDPDLSDNRIGDNQASSIKVMPGCYAILYDGKNYTGTSETIRSDDPDLRDNTIGNDKVSSIKVYCKK